jgi:thiamine-phosphate pyrophosphorylase
MNWKKKAFDNFKLYAVTDLGDEDPEIFKKVEAAYRGGADIVQLRSKTLTDEALYRVGVRFRKIADRFRKLFFVNDRPDLALAVGADGVHVGQDDLPIPAVRKLLNGERLFIGLSTHSLKQALAGAREEVDYIGVGPIFETPTKPAYSAVGLDLIRQVNSKVRLPFVCIGGIDEKNVGEVLGAGARRVAVVRALFGARDVYRAAKTLREKIETYGQ